MKDLQIHNDFLLTMIILHHSAKQSKSICEYTTNSVIKKQNKTFNLKKILQYYSTLIL